MSDYMDERARSGSNQQLCPVIKALSTVREKNPDPHMEQVHLLFSAFFFKQVEHFSVVVYVHVFYVHAGESIYIYFFMPAC